VTAGPPEVSVVIPTRDRWHLLEDALATALGQEETTLEVIVVDDGSSDETPARLAALPDPRLRVLRNPRSLGVAAARNRGIAAARATWVAFLDDDDLWSPRKLRAQLDAAATAQAAFAYGGAIVIDEHGCPKSVLPAPDPERVALELLRMNVIPGGCSNAIARTDAVRRLGGFDEALCELADWDLWIRLAWNVRPASCASLVVAYRKHSENMLVRDRPRVLEELEYLAAKHYETAVPDRIEIDRATFIEWVAKEYSRAGRRWRAAQYYLRAGRRRPGVRALRLVVGALLGGRIRRLILRVRRHRDVQLGPPATPPWLTRYCSVDETA
jgi:glycosyltransferase involved in cell wall biosynthesis